MSGTDSGTRPAFTPPKWRKPAPLSYGHAIDLVGTTGSSLLAGFSLASVIVVTGEARAFRWPGATVLALAAAAVVLIASVQFTYNTRQFLGSPAEVRSRWPEMAEDSALEARLREEQAQSFQRWEKWALWTRAAHGAGVLILLPGLALPCRHRQGAHRAGCAGRRSA